MPQVPNPRIQDPLFPPPSPRKNPGALHISELPTLSEADIATIQTRVSQRVLRWFVRRGWLDPDDARAMWLSPLEFTDRIAALVPPPRVCRLRYHSVVALNPPLHVQVRGLDPKLSGWRSAQPFFFETNGLDQPWRSPAGKLADHAHRRRARVVPSGLLHKHTQCLLYALVRPSRRDS